MRAFVPRQRGLCCAQAALMPVSRRQSSRSGPQPSPQELRHQSILDDAQPPVDGRSVSAAGASASFGSLRTDSDDLTSSAPGPSMPIRTLYPQVKLRARTQERPWQTERPVTTAMMDTQDQDETDAEPSELTAGSTTHPDATPASATSASQFLHTNTDHELSSHVHEKPNEVQQFLEEVRHQVEIARFERNQVIPFPEHPDVSAPLFRRVKRHTKLEVVVPDPDFPTFQRRDQAVALPPSKNHPWVKRTPIGPHIVHGDGQINVHGGTGEVGFDDDPLEAERGRPLPRRFRGLQHRSVVGQPLPQMNGKVLQEAVVRHSFALTGRGVFATRDVKKGETIMVVQSTAQNTGVKGEVNRLEEMITHMLLAAHGTEVIEGENGEEEVVVMDEDAVREARAFLHDWVLTGQPSSLMEHWPAAATQRVIEAIGGPQVLYDLELHPNHIARLAAILDLNSFLVESFYAERKGMAYFPEAGFLNHSCVPNATYDIIPAHTFKESDYYLDEALEREENEARDAEDGEDDAQVDDEKLQAARSSQTEGSGEPRMIEPVDAEEKTNPAHASSAVSTSSSSASTKNVAHLGDAALQHYPDLTDADAPTYLFCCRATEDITAGSEVLISYVPPSWTFDNRQYVLHDRYHFWCKCPKCAPTLDKKYARAPKMMIAIIAFCVFLQILLLYQRDLKNAVDDEIEAIRALPEEERLEALRARGMDVNHFADDEYQKRRRTRAQGFFERMEAEKEAANNRFDDLGTRSPLVQQELNAQGVKW